jgi:hypothetical protein
VIDATLEIRLGWLLGHKPSRMAPPFLAAIDLVLGRCNAIPGGTAVSGRYQAVSSDQMDFPPNY